MGLQSALSTALTGLTAAETTIDVVGNNLANSNTVGFKASNAAFSTQFMQTMSLGSAPTETSGGSNPRQTGLGTMVADIAPDFSQGTLEISSSPTDLAIQGDGFFIVQGQTGEHLYTRNGIFKMNSANELVTISGNRVMGYGINDDFDIQRTVLVPIEISLGAAAVAEATENAYLEGNLSPTGDVADTAERIQSDILGDAQYTAPTTAPGTLQSVPPDVAAESTSGIGVGGGALDAGAVYQYRFVYANGPYAGTGQPDEGTPSDVVTVSLGPGQDRINLQDIPISPLPPGTHTHVRIYRTEGGGSDFFYLDEIDVSLGIDTYPDTAGDVALGAQLNNDRLTGNYSYYVTFATAAGGPGNGTESRPSPLGGPQNVANGRVLLHDLPTGDPADGWQVRRIYRNVSNDDTNFYYVGEIGDVTSDVILTDKLTDAEISDPTNPTFAMIDPDGPKTVDSTLLTNVLMREGSIYEQIFEEGTLQFAGDKGGRTLAMKEFEITAASTVLDLYTFLEEALGIQEGSDIPPDAGSSTSPGGKVTLDGRILLTGNNGEGNAIDVKAASMQLVTASGKENIDLSFDSIQSAVGESAVTDFLVYDTLGIPLRVRLTAVLESRGSTATVYRWFADSSDNDPQTGADIAVGTGLLTFDGTGSLVDASETAVSIDRRHVSSTSPLTFEIDFSKLSGLAATEDEGSYWAVSRQDGCAPGSLTAFAIDESGIIRGTFSNGVTRGLGQIRLARFANPTALEQRGENLYSEGVNSGLPVEGDPGQQGIGNIVAGAVELSNTDISGNLIDLILASTMYRGNTRVITTAQEMIDELLLLRR
ncbi:MAG TPA: flagellar hook-basal body complex protein [Thermoguttaceae bacterium]|nr:flagellar hook-basal body complex protein [Thermoguttaceae bacterium]